MISMLLQCAFLLFCFMTCGFIIAIIKKNNSIVDIFWGVGFILIAWFTLFKTNLFLPRQLLITTLITIWGLRLSGYILSRNWGKKEDQRYTQLAKKWGSYFYLNTFLKVFMLQGLLILLISASTIVVNTTTSNGINFFNIVALTGWVFGFVFQVISDKQLQNFLIKRNSKDKVLQTGLWKYSRHPNYFGEVVMWWSIWLIALSVPYGWYAIISPITITSIFVFLTIPITEKQFDGNKEYEKYKSETSVLIPLPKRI